MNTSQISEGSKQPYNFYFADQLNVSVQRRDSRSSSVSSGKMSNSIKLMKGDQVKENEGQKRFLSRQVSIDSAVQNQFMSGFGDSSKNISAIAINNQSDIFHELDRKKDQKHTLIEKLQQSPSKQGQNENENSFLLGTQTYKEICIEEHTKKAQLANVLDSSNNSGGPNNKCEIHDSPFQIVCIEDKSLICSHCAIFGDHKTHSLAPLKQIEKFISLKRQQVNDIIANYKSLQLGIKQKAFMSEFSQKIRTKKGETIISIRQAFKSIREFLNNYENDIMAELQKLYVSLQNKISEAIKRISLDSNRAAFQKWQEDATKIVQQLGFRQLSKSNQIGLFLSNFKVPSQISNSIPSTQSLQMVSMQAQGKHYLNEIQEQLNLNINEVMKISSHFKFNLNPDYQQKLKELMMFQADAHLQGLMQENQLATLLGQLRNNNMGNIHVRNSFSHFDNNPTNKSIALNIKEKQLASTINSLSQSTPFFNMGKIKRMSTTKNNINHKIQTHLHHQPGMNSNGNIPLKFKKRQTCGIQQPVRRSQMSVRSVDVPFSLIASKSFCQQNQKNKRISPCPRNIVKIPNEHLFVSSATSRVNRCSSREPANIYQHSHVKQQETQRDFKRKQIQGTNQPLQAIQHYQKMQTQTFDLSNCQLNDTEIIYFVQKAAKIRKIKHLKLAGNQLTTSGLEKILTYLPNCNLMNLSSNKLSENTIDLLLKKRERILQLKMLNLANNKLNERKIKEKISEFKRMGIVVTL